MVNGRITSKMEKGQKHGQMAPAMKESMLMAFNMGLAFTNGPMVVVIRENGTKAKLKASERTLGQMGEATPVSGKIVTWKEWVFTLGQTNVCILGTKWQTKSMGSGSISGQMAACLVEIGKTVSNMALAYT